MPLLNGQIYRHHARQAGRAYASPDSRPAITRRIILAGNRTVDLPINMESLALYSQLKTNGRWVMFPARSSTDEKFEKRVSACGGDDHVLDMWPARGSQRRLNWDWHKKLRKRFLRVRARNIGHTTAGAIAAT